MEDRLAALVELGRALKAAGYAFVTVSPETHRRVDERAAGRGEREARSLRDVFGWSRPFTPDLLPPRMLELARAADALGEEGEMLRSKVRFSTLHGRLHVHSAYPTINEEAVFFGPDTYRYCDLVARVLAGTRAARVVDVGCGSGAGGLVAAEHAERVVLADVNPEALAFSTVNAALAGLESRVEVVSSDVLARVDGPIDVVIANPPYMADPGRRAYRDGGGSLGEGLGVRMARDTLERLGPGGRLVLYTGAAVVDGVDTFLAEVREVCVGAGAAWNYRELDPDVFGEEIEHNDTYAAVERIAAVALVARLPLH